MSPKRLFAPFLLALAMLVTGAPEPIGPLGLTYAHADDDDDDDDDGGGGGGASQSRGSSSGGRALGSGRSGGSPPRLLRYLQRKFSPRRQRQYRQRQVRPRQRQARRAAPPVIAQSRPDELVAFGLGVTQLAQLNAAGFRVVERTPAGQGIATELVRLAVPGGLSGDAAVSRARELAPGAAIDANHLYRPSDAGDCGGRPCIAPSLVGWPLASSQQSPACRGEGVSIGLVDTAINAAHPTFLGSRLEVVRLGEAAEPDEGRQHGTAVAALLVGRARGATPGLVPDARLIAVDAFESEGRNQQRADAFTLARAIDLLTARDVDVLNMSLAGPDNAVLKTLIGIARSRDIVLVAAAGNAGPRARPVYPAAYGDVVAVTAVDRQKNVYRRANRGSYVDIAAPGVNVWTAASISGARPKTGTSLAAPFVTAAAALAISAGKDVATIEQQLEATALDLGDAGRDDIYGWGLLNVRDICPAAG